MGCTNGRLLVCNRCGRTHFCPRTNLGSTEESLWETFVPWPKGWYSPNIVDFLCPNCCPELKKDGCNIASLIEKYNMNKIPIVTQPEVEQNQEEVLETVREKGPIRIRGCDDNDLVLFTWTDFLERFGSLYKAEEVFIFGEEVYGVPGDNS